MASNKSKYPETIFLASGNRDKLKELQQMLEPLGIKLKSTLDVENPADVEEDKDSLKGNALKKARYWHQETDLPSLADDTGLEVEVLNGRPGVYSARYAGEDASYDDNVQKLLSELEGQDIRSARFRTVMAFVTGDEDLFFEGVCRGEITEKPVGTGGFGYDPVFIPDGFKKTFAEIDPKEKNAISHRGKALQKFVDYLMAKKT